MGSHLKTFTHVLLILFVSSGITLASGYENYFISANWLKKHLYDDGLVIIDARGEKQYLKNHIPKALPVSWEKLSSPSQIYPFRNWGTVSDPDLLSDVISQLGITKTSKIVIYSDTQHGWGEDGRIFWTFRIAGLTNLRMLDGGIKAWEREGGELTKKKYHVQKSNFKISSLNTSSVIDTETLKKVFKQTILLDTRTRKEYNGAAKFGEERGGHVPGAVLVPYHDLLKDGYIRPEDELHLIMQSAGITLTDPVVTYCTAGVRSAYVQVILEMLGYSNSLNYDDSYHIWAHETDAPIGRVVRGKTYHFIRPDQLKQKLIMNEPVFLVDIQPHTDFIQHHIANAIESNAYPVKNEDERSRLKVLIPEMNKTSDDIIILGPEGTSGARRAFDFYKQMKIPSTRLYILENGLEGWIKNSL